MERAGVNDGRTIPVDPERMMADLDAMRAFGRTGTGVVRPAFSAPDIASRRFLIERIAAAGLEPRIDRAGNVFGLPPGEGKCLLVGSHSDTQPQGGWLDGVYGVIAGLEIARASLEADGPRIACVSFQDEEGRFGGLTGSRLFAGTLGEDDADRLLDTEGRSFAEARRSLAGLPGPIPVDPAMFSGYLEMHIEQGPFLDAAGEAIGVVERIVGIRERTIVLVGEQNHAGTTPMQTRRDAVQGMIVFAGAVEPRLRALAGATTVWTIGMVRVSPNASSIVPGRVEFSFQWRDADEDRLDEMSVAIDAVLAETAAVRGLELEAGAEARLPATASDPAFLSALDAAAERFAPGRWRRMTSGALHDAASLAPLMTMAMLFVPSIGGISHSFAEDTRREDLMLGLEVLAEAAARIATR